MNTERTILITCAAQNAALACARSLHAAGWRVILADHQPRAKAFAGKACRQRLLLENDPLQAPAAYADELIDFVSRNSVDVLFPVTDAAIFALLPRRNDLEKHVAVPWAAPEALRAAADKNATSVLADRLGLPLPQTWTITDPADLPPDIRYPVAIKPKSSLVAGRKIGVTYAGDKAALGEQLQSLPGGAFPVMAQQRIVGPGQGYFGVWNRGEPVVECAHQRWREMPPSGGVSTLREAIELPEDMRDFSRRLLREWRWHGPVMVEFKRGGDGRPYLMEVNGRLWGSLQLAIDAGIDIPLASVLVALGEAAPQMTYRPGVRTRWVLGDLDAVLTRLLKSDAALDLPPDARSRGWWASEFLLDFFRSRVKSEVFRWRDPGPFWAELRAWVSNKHQMLRNRLRRRRGIEALVHAHTRFSHDGELSVSDLARLLRGRGVRLCCLAEHTDDMDERKVEEMIEACRRESDGDFLMVPGLEFTLPDGQHLAGLGVARLLPADDPVALCDAIRNEGGLAVLAHPRPEALAEQPALARALDAVEVWNTLRHGTFVPAVDLLAAHRRALGEGLSLLAWQGGDFHRPANLRSARMWICAKELSWPAVREAARAGRYSYGNRLVRLGPRGAGWFARVWFRFLSIMVSSARSLRNRFRAKQPPTCWEYWNCTVADCSARETGDGGFICWRIVGSFAKDGRRGRDGHTSACEQCDFYRLSNPQVIACRQASRNEDFGHDDE